MLIAKRLLAVEAFLQCYAKGTPQHFRLSLEQLNLQKALHQTRHEEPTERADDDEPAPEEI